jgi:GDP/UDP-N,N'-diacetylbacillosamine 2-epimerase (hydrolysing)
MNRRICIITGSRAEYGLLRWVMNEIALDPTLDLQIIATGGHFSPSLGSTYKEIESDGFVIDKRVEILEESDSTIGLIKSIAKANVEIGFALRDLKPDVVLILGDRYEIFAAATAALVERIPIAHIHGGETTEGVYDEAFRHSITKMSHIHFVATEPYSKRVIQLGESPESVFLVGALGVDAIERVSLLSKEELEQQLNFKLLKKNLLITYHPSTLDDDFGIGTLEVILSSLSKLQDTGLIFTLSNADPAGQRISKMIENYVSENENSRAYPSLGQRLYYSLLNNVDGVVGNSSSGLLEAPSFGIGTINIGDRQLGRLSASSVINCKASEDEISKSIQKLYSEKFKRELDVITNPYAIRGAAEAIVNILRSIELKGLIKKKFYDLP